MHFFVIVYDRVRGERLETLEFDTSEVQKAANTRFNREVKYRTDPNIEVVLLGAPSIRVLEKTHGRYFKSPAALGDELTALLG